MVEKVAFEGPPLAEEPQPSTIKLPTALRGELKKQFQKARVRKGTKARRLVQVATKPATSRHNAPCEPK